MPAGLEGSVLPPFVIRHWLHFAVYYERAAVTFIGGWLRNTEQPDAVIDFAHQLRDEATHYGWLRDHLLEFGEDAAAFVPPGPWRELMEDFYPGLDHLVERLAAHNLASETGALGFMEWNLTKFPAPLRATVEKVVRDEKFHVAFGRKLLATYCTTPALQERARSATFAALERMGRAREVFVEISEGDRS